MLRGFINKDDKDKVRRQDPEDGQHNQGAEDEHMAPTILLLFKASVARALKRKTRGYHDL